MRDMPFHMNYLVWARPYATTTMMGHCGGVGGLSQMVAWGSTPQIVLRVEALGASGLECEMSMFILWLT
jgi:hypothetical protein